ncbi:hypothetical protein P171DRAFT_407996 [Karstenula rhodostoma CBS 690.94]|uniref:Uncharacterized protein n=1 Tax=Karstenula rhodostoma CBS 690.94 TaxID=1392251 RepID=A0A9P4PQZ1_9PLEO|nr:hypothetical protein P171DRAFT_407996 [Karstenula rhodostoma CBS 690.94]
MPISHHTALRAASAARSRCINNATSLQLAPSRQVASTAATGTQKGTKASTDSSDRPNKHDDQKTKSQKTQAELDKELQLKMQGLSGDGGESGVEYEDGQPVSMKRSVKDNMFRYI